MKAVLLTGFGGVENLNLREDVSEPELGSCDVIVKVKAVALNRLDVWIRKGALPVKPQLPHILGSDISGVVVDVGNEVKNVKVGDEVVLIPSLSCGVCKFCQAGDDNLCSKYDIIGLRSKGGYAEYISVPERNVLKKPKNLSFEEAASFPLTFLTSWNALVDKGNIDGSKRVFIWAGSSGVGVAAVQIAKSFNAFVITTAGNEENMENCRRLGADIVLNHYEDDIEKEILRLFPEGIDIVIDHVGKETFLKGLSILRKGGVLVFFGTTTGSEVEINLRHIFVKEISLKGVYMGRRAELFKITDMFERGIFKPVIDSIYGMEDIREAHERIEKGGHFGKIVIRVS